MSKAKTGLAGLTVGALGVVFGDIGTSPLYAIQALFSPYGLHLAVNSVNVYGIISLIIWTVTMVVSVKYVGWVMRAGNKGEGGIMALVALVRSSPLSPRWRGGLVMLGLAGVALFYGDSAITPAISMLSAVEGLRAVSPNFHSLVLPITLALITVLFWVQKYGTGVIGRFFGPVMLVWFAVIGVAGAWQVLQYPDILQALSPVAAASFFAAQPLVAFVSLGAVVLVITGAEALYADMGHFGRPAISRAWFFVVFPALVLCYMGQGALLLYHPAQATGPFIALFPTALQAGVVVLATLATLIASQSVISGAFSLTRQAVQLGYLPRLRVLHTSDKEIGQIYVPSVNILLFVIVTIFVVSFGSSERLAGAYGIAVSGTLAIDTVLFLAVMRTWWRRGTPFLILIGSLFLSVDLLYAAANVSKLKTGGWMPIAVSTAAFLMIHTWVRGQRIVTAERRAKERTLQHFVDDLQRGRQNLTRVPGNAVFIGHHADLTPLALRAAVEQLHELPQKVVIVTVRVLNLAHVPEQQRAVFDNLSYDDGISHLSLSYGFHDSPNIPKTLKSLRHLSPELNFNADKASYFVSLSKVVPTHRRNLAAWRKTLYCLLSRNALSTSDYYHLPTDRTVEMRSLIKL